MGANAFLSNAQLRGSLPFDAPPPQPVAAPPARRGPSYDQFGQAMLQAYQDGDLARFSALYAALGKGLSSGVVTAPAGRLGVQEPQQAASQPEAAGSNAGRQPAQQPASAPATPEPLFFDPSAGRQQATQPNSAPEPAFFIPGGGPQGGNQPDPQQAAPQPQFANEGILGPGGAAAAGLESFADAATLGLAPKAEAALAGLYGHLRYGVPLGQAYDMASEAAQQRGEQLAAAHPYANAAGVLGGAVGGAVGMAPAVEGLGLGAVAGQRVRNVAKAVGLGAGMGAAESALHGGDTAENSLAAAVGGIGGPVAGKVAGAVANRLGPASNRAWRILANKLPGTSAADLKTWFEEKMAQGVKPNIAAALDAQSRGELQGFAAANPAMRGALVDEARAAGAATGTAPQEMARSAAFRQGMESLDRSSPVSLPQDLRDDPAVLDALKGYQYRALRTRLADDNLTLDDADQLRQRLAGASTKPGDEFIQARDAVTQAANDQNPGYAKLVSDYKSASDEIAGLAHGQGGGTQADMPPDLQRRIASSEARQGLAEGRQQYQNAKALAEVSGGVGKAPSDARGFENLAVGMAETAGGSHAFGLRNVAHGVGNILRGESLPRDVQLQLAKSLATTDPGEFSAAVDRLRRGGMAADKIRALQSTFSAYAGGGSGALFWPDQPSQ